MPQKLAFVAVVICLILFVGGIIWYAGPWGDLSEWDQPEGTGQNKLRQNPDVNNNNPTRQPTDPIFGRDPETQKLMRMCRAMKTHLNAIDNASKSGKVKVLTNSSNIIARGADKIRFYNSDKRYQEFCDILKESADEILVALQQLRRDGDLNQKYIFSEVRPLTEKVSLNCQACHRVYWKR